MSTNKKQIYTSDLYSYEHLQVIADIIIHDNKSDDKMDILLRKMFDSEKLIGNDDPDAIDTIERLLRRNMPRRTVIAVKTRWAMKFNNNVLRKLPKTRSVILLLTPDSYDPFFMCGEQLSLEKNVVSHVFITHAESIRTFEKMGGIESTLLPIGICINTWWTRIKIYVASSDSRRILFMNFTNKYNRNVHVSPCIKERFVAQEALLRNGFVMHPSCDFDKMIAIMSTFKFVACPPAIGQDTHRFWEALSCGCAVVLNDWEVLRRSHRGLLPALFVRSKLNKECDCNYCCLCAINIKHNTDNTDIFIDQFGDFFVQGWSGVTYRVLTLLHRFIGWKRSSSHIEKITSASYWICRVRSYC